jgi:hypothetical protein
MRANDLHTGQVNSLSRNPIIGIDGCCARRQRPRRRASYCPVVKSAFL